MGVGERPGVLNQADDFRERLNSNRTEGRRGERNKERDGQRDAGSSEVFFYKTHTLMAFPAGKRGPGRQSFWPVYWKFRIVQQYYHVPHTTRKPRVQCPVHRAPAKSLTECIRIVLEFCGELINVTGQRWRSSPTHHGHRTPR